MTPVFAVILLILCALALFIVPLLPAFIELRRKSDAAPLQVVRDYDVDVHNFANTFRRYIEEHYHGAYEHCVDRAKPFYGTDKEGKRFIIVTDEDVLLSDKEKNDQFTYRIFLGCHCLRLPGAMSYLSELYAHESIFGGEENIYRAILAEKDILLSPQSMLLRWLHAGRDLAVGQDSILHGRVSADHAIHIETGCKFERLYAPRIEFGLQSEPGSVKQQRPQAQTRAMPANSNSQFRRWLYKHDVDIPQGTSIDADLVVTGMLGIGSGSCITGSLKSHETMQIGHDARINGSVVSDADLYVQNNCQVMGPIISEGDVHIGHGCQLGNAAQPTTITAQRIFIETGSVAYGTVWAHEHGAVIESASDTGKTENIA